MAQAGASAIAVPIPTDEAAFLSYLAQRLHQTLPDYQFRVTGRALWGEGRRGEPLGQLDALPTHRQCLNEPVQCERIVDQYTRTVGELARIHKQPPDVSMLRLTLRTAEFVNDMRRQVPADGAAPIYARPAPGGLMAVAVLDFQNSLRFVGESELRRLGLSEDQLFDHGRRNLRTRLMPLQAIAPRLPDNDFGRIEAEDHTASRVLLHDDWAVLAAQMKQSLIVVLPTPNNLLYCDSANPFKLAAMMRAAQDLYRRTPRPLSLQTLRWTRSGWEVWNGPNDHGNP